MNIKRTLIISTFAATVVLSASCSKDDYHPIYLVDAETETALEGDQLQLSIFSEGEKYLIRGGKGNYTISVADNGIADFRYDGDTLTFFPISGGTTQSVIADRSGNSCTLNVKVANPQNKFTVNNIRATVIGGSLTQDETKALKNKITEEGPVRTGGRIELTYTDEELASGDIKIYPDAEGSYRPGIFEQSRKYDENTGERRTQIDVTMAGGQKYVFTVAYLQLKRYLLYEDVTDQYKGTYPALEKALRIYEIEVEQ